MCAYNKLSHGDILFVDDFVFFGGIRRVRRPFAFRCDIVPGTKKASGRMRIWKRPKTTQEKRVNCDSLHKSFSRGKRRNLPDTYDDRVRTDYKAKSWKDCTKKRRQWNDKAD